MKLSGKQLENLAKALSDAFPDRTSLEQMLLFKLNRSLNEITGDCNLATVVFELIKEANARGWVLDLVKAARQENPGNYLLEAIASELLNPTNVEEYNTPTRPNLQPPSHTPRSNKWMRISAFATLAGGFALFLFININSRTTLEIIKPAKNSDVERVVDFTGTYNNLPENSSIQLYVYAPSAKKYYCHPATSKNNGNWSVNNVNIGTNGSTDSKRTYEVSVLVLDETKTALQACPVYSEVSTLPSNPVTKDTIFVTRR